VLSKGDGAFVSMHACYAHQEHGCVCFLKGVLS
jgi:hypothetical protein